MRLHQVGIAYKELYGEPIKKDALECLKFIFSSGDLDELFYQTKEYESGNKEFLKKFDEKYPQVLNINNANDIANKRFNTTDDLGGHLFGTQVKKSKKEDTYER